MSRSAVLWATPRMPAWIRGHGFFAPRVGFAYRLNNKTVIRTGAGITVDPDSMRELRDEYPFDLAPNYAGDGAGTIAVDPANSNAGMPIGGCSAATPTCYGIPIPVAPNYSSGFVALPITGSPTPCGRISAAATSRAGTCLSSAIWARTS